LAWISRIYLLGAGSNVKCQITKGVFAVEHEVDSDSQSPHIDSVAILLVFVNFGCHELSGTEDGA
jgi:hypothetical protein